MNETLDVEQSASESSERLGVRRDFVAKSIDDASAQPAFGAQPDTADWERRIVRIAEWARDAGMEDDDGIVWPTEQAIQSAYQIIQRLRSRRFAVPTEIVPSGDGGIVFSRRTGNSRQEIEVSDSGDVELLLFMDGRLISRKPW